VNIVLCCRLFLVHEDGSGTELLSSQTAEELLYQAYADRAIALLKEPLADTQGVLLNTSKIKKHNNNNNTIYNSFIITFALKMPEGYVLIAIYLFIYLFVCVLFANLKKY